MKKILSGALFFLLVTASVGNILASNCCDCCCESEPETNYSLENGWPEGAYEWKILDLFASIDERKFTSEQLESLYNHFFDKVIKQMTQNGEISHGYFYDGNQTADVLVKAIKNHKTILEKFLALLPTFHCRTDCRNMESSHIFKQVLNELLGDPSVSQKIIDIAEANFSTIDRSFVTCILEKYPGLAYQNLHNRFFDEVAKQLTQDEEPSFYLHDSNQTATILIRAIKKHEPILKKFLDLLPIFHCRIGWQNQESRLILKQVVRELLDDPRISPKIIDVAKANLLGINKTVVSSILKKHPDLAFQFAQKLSNENSIQKASYPLVKNIQKNH